VIDVIVRGVDWIEAHPAVGAVVYGWVFGICVTQAAKRYFPLDWSPTRVKRTAQAIAVVSAGVFAWRVWPATNLLAFDFALLAGLSCPVIYTCLKVALPNVLRGWGWKEITWNRISKL
jgi:hypothetical protein